MYASTTGSCVQERLQRRWITICTLVERYMRLRDCTYTKRPSTRSDFRVTQKVYVHRTQRALENNPASSTSGTQRSACSRSRSAGRRAQELNTPNAIVEPPASVCPVAKSVYVDDDYKTTTHTHTVSARTHRPEPTNSRTKS